MSRPIIEVENLSKCYRLGAIGATSLRDSFDRITQRLRGKAPKIEAQDFWALRDVSFTVQPGEVVGIIGRNGAGKSTLLKILSRITEPTSGHARMRGRVASLLEVGTGFHPDLTGRENVSLNGAMLGMSRTEVRKRFDEIVAFAELAQFIDTPVKRYSSGMYVRLAFAVAAHLDPEILIVDEVLAVGDAEFQRKCLGKMSDVARGGRTILFVSHNLDAVQRMTSRALLLEQGRLKALGPTADVIRQYHAESARFSENVENAFRSVGTPEQVTIRQAYFSDAQGVRRRSFLPREEIYFNVVMEGGARLACELAFALETDSGIPIFASHFSDLQGRAFIEGAVHARVALAPNLLRHGTYQVSLGVYAPEFRKTFDELLHLPAFSVEGFHSDMPADGRWGQIYLPLQWSLAPAGRSPCPPEFAPAPSP